MSRLDNIELSAGATMVAVVSCIVVVYLLYKIEVNQRRLIARQTQTLNATIATRNTVAHAQEATEDGDETVETAAQDAVADVVEQAEEADSGNSDSGE